MYKYENIRNFYFENEKGEQIDCQKINGNLFFFNVSGLGFEENIEYEQVGNTFIQNKKEIKQNQISGDLEFYEMTYDEYSSFINFVLQSTELRIIYIPKKKERIKYYRDIDIISIPKSEEDEYNILISTIIINCKSLWYEENKAVYKIEAQEDEIRWDFEWDSSFADYNTRSLSFINKGHVEAPVEIEISGHVINPCISLLIEGELYQEIKLNVEILQYEKLLYGTKENEFHIDKEKVDKTVESLFNLDILPDFQEVDEVIRLPVGKSCEIKLTADNEIANAQITIYPQYKAV